MGLLIRVGEAAVFRRGLAAGPRGMWRAPCAAAAAHVTVVSPTGPLSYKHIKQSVMEPELL